MLININEEAKRYIICIDELPESMRELIRGLPRQ